MAVSPIYGLEQAIPLAHGIVVNVNVPLAEAVPHEYVPLVFHVPLTEQLLVPLLLCVTVFVALPTTMSPLEA